MKKTLVIIFFLPVSLICDSQILNAYAKVTGINGASTTLTVSNVNEASHTFSVGGQVIVMQMQDDVIGTNTTNISSFGNVSSIANAGIYEIKTISSRSPATGTPTTITFSSGLVNSFNVGTNSSVQIITFRDLGSNYTTTANILGLAWDGNVGGVVAIQVANTLTLNHSILADGIGFIGGSKSNNNTGSICTATNTALYISNSANLGSKGQGIYLSTSIGFTNGRGKILNGGGGGGDHNAGGGGGANFSSGGQGGNGYNSGATTCTLYPTGGLGGLGLSSYITSSRIFMGGAGGGAQQNNSNGTSGGNGGGIILLKANTVLTNSTCSSAIKISANGISASNTTGGGNDGAGGGGAGGSIILQVNNYSNTSACPLTINSNGGNGGSVTNGTPHAGGGGGGQGVIIFSGSQPTLNLTSATNSGSPGLDNSGGSSSGTSGGGISNGGIFSSSSGPLPVELIYFNATAEKTCNNVVWKSAIEVNFKHYELESCEDGVSFNKIATVNSIGNLTSINNYNYLDINYFKPFTYYRLKIVDVDNSFSYSSIISVEYGKNTKSQIIVFPNPASDELYLSLISPDQKEGTIVFRDLLGRSIFQQKINCSLGIENIYINTTDFASGTYIININYNDAKSENIKVIINNMK